MKGQAAVPQPLWMDQEKIAASKFCQVTGLLRPAHPMEHHLVYGLKS